MNAIENKRVKVPEGMRESASEKKGHALEEFWLGINHALEWISNNYVPPTENQINELRSKVAAQLQYSFSGDTLHKHACAEAILRIVIGDDETYGWNEAVQSTMFTEPEPEPEPEDTLADMLLTVDGMPDCSRPSSKYYNDSVREAFKRGQQSMIRKPTAPPEIGQL